MSLPRILILESTPPDLIASQGYRAAYQSKATFDALELSAYRHVVEPNATNFETCLLGQFDSVVFTEAGVDWSLDAKEAAPLRTVKEKIFKTDLPVWGSCNGMQLAALVLGGTVRSSLNGLEVKFSRGTRKTVADKSHPVLHGRAEVFAVLCIHRDEVDCLKIGTVDLAENDHSSIQSLAYRAEDIGFWGVQYHPEYRANAIAKSLRKVGRKFSAVLTLINDLKVWDSDIEVAERLGTTCDALQNGEYTRELANWLIHVKNRISS